MTIHRTTQIVLALTAICFLFACGAGEQKRPSEVSVVSRPAAVAGAFYPGNADHLRRVVSASLDQAPGIQADGEIVAAVAPHAGYVYSGHIAAYTHRFLADVEMDTIVIIGHDSHAGAVAFLCPVDYFETPLGKVPVDREMIEKMLAFNSGIRADMSMHSREHTVEVQLPFLQVMNKGCRIVPVLFGTPSAKNCRILADAIISAAGGRKVFVLASTDMSHYPSYDEARELDFSTLELFRSMNVETLFAHMAKHEREKSIPGLSTAMCAKGGVGTAIFFAKARGANRAQILKYANSGDIPGGDKNRVVGYSSALFLKTP